MLRYFITLSLSLSLMYKSIVLLILCFTIQVFGQRECRLYQIGNSHTNDCLSQIGLPFLFDLGGLVLENVWHMMCAKSLKYISENPKHVCLESNNFGTWLEALDGNTWDAITLQAHNGGTGDEEFEAIKTISVTLHETRQTQVFIYANWPRLTVGSYLNNWGKSYERGAMPVA